MQRWGHFQQPAWNLLPPGGKGTFAEEGERPQAFAPYAPCGEGRVGAAEISSRSRRRKRVPAVPHSPSSRGSEGKDRRTDEEQGSRPWPRLEAIRALMGWGSVPRGSELPDLGVCKTPPTMERQGSGDLAGTRPVTGVRTQWQCS